MSRLLLVGLRCPATRSEGLKDASETRSHSAEQTRGAWRVPRVPGWSTRLGRVRATRLGSCTCPPCRRVATNLTAVPRSSNSGLGPRWRNCARASSPPTRAMPSDSSRMLQEGALAGLQAGGRRGHGPLGVLPKCFGNSRYQVVLAKDPSYFPKTQPGPFTLSPNPSTL